MAVWFVCSYPVSAQILESKIPYRVVTATVALSSADQEQIDEYLVEHIKHLTQGSPEEVVQARRKLIEPLTWAGGTEIFHLAYSSSASHQLAQAINSKDLHVRLNTMIIVNSLNDAGIVSLIRKGLTDESPAVRYWAGKAVSQVGARDRLSDDEQKALLDVLVATMLKEKSERVLQRLLVGLVGLTIPEAATQLLEGLNKRVSLHAANVSMPLGAALEGLKTLFVKTVQAKANGQDISVHLTRNLALVAYRYLVLSADLLDKDRPSQEIRKQYQEMIKLTDAILGWTIRQMPPQDTTLPPSIKDELNRQNWPMIRLRAEEWKRVLAQEPFNFSPIDLMVSIPEGA